MFWPYKGGSNSLNTFANITTNSFESLYILDSNSNSTLIGFENNQCVLIDSENYPCNSDKLNLFFELINKFDEGELISTTVDSHRTLKVHADIYERYVEINLTDGNIVKMYLGTTPRLRSTHFRLADSSNVYLSPNYTNSKFLAVANDWVETEYFDVEEDEFMTEDMVLQSRMSSSNVRFGMGYTLVWREHFAIEPFVHLDLVVDGEMVHEGLGTIQTAKTTDISGSEFIGGVNFSLFF